MGSTVAFLTMTKSRKLLAIIGVFLAILFGLMSASIGSDLPWNEKVIQRHIDIDNFRGMLDGDRLTRLRNAGEILFTGKFTKQDGFGRPMATQAIIPTKSRYAAESDFHRLAGPDANACSSCHNDPIVGAAGHGTANVFVSEGFTNASFDSIDPQFSNERNTNHLMGSGLVELLAREMTQDLIGLRVAGLRQARKTDQAVVVKLITKGVAFGQLAANPDGTVDLDGVEGVDSDLHVRPFSHKGVFSSLRQFTVNAMNHHHGMQAHERFGVRWTGESDFDEDGVEMELTKGDISALVAWQATLAPPVQLIPENKNWAEISKLGEGLFVTIGCAECHRPALALESTLFSDPGPLDVAGTLRASEVEKSTSYDLAEFAWIKSLPRNTQGHVMIPLFSDLKRHKILDARIQVFGNELLSQRFVGRDQFQTTELWGVGSTAPYGHRGNLTTLDEAIRGHGGDADAAGRNYSDLSKAERDAIIAYLRTLVIEYE